MGKTNMHTRNVEVSLVVRLDDMITGEIINPSIDFNIESVSLIKSDGYCVFTGQRPNAIKITSKYHETINLPINSIQDLLIRIAPVPNHYKAQAIHTFPLQLEEGESAYIGFLAPKKNYLLLSSHNCEIALSKEDYADLTMMYHALIPATGSAIDVFIKKGLGYGKYTISAPLPNDIPLARARLLPLFHVVGTGSEMRIPFGAESVAAYIRRKDVITYIAL